MASLTMSMASVRSVGVSRRRSVAVRAAPKPPAELGNKITEGIEDAKKACAEGTTGECAAAWDTVEELSAAASHKKATAKASGASGAPLTRVMDYPLEKFCETSPDADECRVYSD